MNVLWWIRKPSRGFKPFVANGIGEIQSLTNPQQWRHVSTKENPADLPTRGTSVANLKDNALWWSGPEFLKSDEKDWPKVKIEVNQENLSEVRKQARIQIETENEEDLTLLATTHETSWRLQPERYSSWNRLVRMRALVQRFIENCTRKLEDRCTGDITYQEIADAETAIIKETQRQETTLNHARNLSEICANTRKNNFGPTRLINYMRQKTQTFGTCGENLMKTTRKVPK